MVTRETAQVGTGTKMSGLPTNQDLVSQNVPTSLLTRNNFRLARDSEVVRTSNLFDSALLVSAINICRPEPLPRECAGDQAYPVRLRTDSFRFATSYA